jgi:hypothetical protein
MFRQAGIDLDYVNKEVLQYSKQQSLDEPADE